jgi:hypothetical protein
MNLPAKLADGCLYNVGLGMFLAVTLDKNEEPVYGLKFNQSTEISLYYRDGAGYRVIIPDQTFYDGGTRITLFRRVKTWEFSYAEGKQQGQGPRTRFFIESKGKVLKALSGSKVRFGKKKFKENELWELRAFGDGLRPVQNPLEGCQNFQPQRHFLLSH